MMNIQKLLMYALSLVCVVWMAACSFDPSLLDPENRYNAAVEKLGEAESERKRFYVLADAGKAAFEVGKLEEAGKYAQELLDLAPKYSKDWNYGNALHDGHMVLGRLALREGNVDEAKGLLLEAGKTPGSPQLNSFGPNMSLAHDLLQAEEDEVVLEYFTLCRAFWESGESRLSDWTRKVREGQAPDFGANLVY